MRAWVLVSALLAVLGSSTRAAAYTLDWEGCKLATGPSYPDGGGDPFIYYVDETQPLPGGIPVANIQTEVIAAFQQWGDQSCSYFSARFDGGITNPQDIGGVMDGQSVIASFIESDQDPRYDSDLGAGAAVGVALYYEVNGVIESCDTEYNAVDWMFADDGDSAAIDFPSVALHEAGHCLGLAHAPEDPNSVMYPTIADGQEKRTLDAHDINNLCQLYPVTGSIGSPCSVGSCGGGLSCIADTVNGGSFCSHPCDLNDTTPGALDGGCEDGFGCQTSTEINGASAACFPGQGDEAQVGGECVFDNECAGANAVCVQSAGLLTYPDGYCTEACDTNDCPDGNTCVQIGEDANGNPQDYCLNNCSSVTGGCRDDGYVCNPLTADGTGFCYPACASSDDCGGAACLCSGVCVTIGNAAGFIGSKCSANSDCATGAFCILPVLGNDMPSGWNDGYCAESCGGTNSCVTCPTGSACVVDGQEGQAYCLQLCSANGGCRSGYGCASEMGTNGMVEVCEPGLGSQCVVEDDCPVGELCVAGVCEEPGSDGGCLGALCPLPDGGVTAQGMGGDAGPPNNPPATPHGGCGCGEPGGEQLLLGLMLVVALRRRAPW